MIAPAMVFLLFLLTVAMAAALAAADGVALGRYSSGSPPDSDVARAHHEREHRALGIARVIVYLTMGVALVQTMELSALVPVVSVPLQIAIAIVVVAVTEGAGRSIAHARSDAVANRLRPFGAMIARALSPVVAVGAGIERLLNLLLPASPVDDEDRETSAEQFREVVAAEAEISVAEEALLAGVFTMGRTEVHEIMVPRVDIVGVERSTPWSEVVDRVRSSQQSRLPVFDGSVDDVIGVLYAKDLLADAVRDEALANENWHRLIRAASFIPISKPIDVLLREFQASHTHMAIVTDEYGGTAGLVTIEDILEEIVGEIRDEYDVDEPEVEQEGPDRFWVSGRLSIENLSERLQASFEADDVTTVGGLVYTLFGRVPRSGDSIASSGFRIVVERVCRRRIERVYFERLEHAAARRGE